MAALQKQQAADSGSDSSSFQSGSGAKASDSGQAKKRPSMKGARKSITKLFGGKSESKPAAVAGV